MKYINFVFLLLICISANGYSSGNSNQNRLSAIRSPNQVTSSLWVTAYLPSWELNMGAGTTGNYGNLPVTNIDWSAFTHVIMFACGPTSNGTLSFGNLLPSRRKPFNDIAHANGTPVLLAVGGAGGEVWGDACNPGTIDIFLKNVLNELDINQYDGIDLDIEPFRNTGTVNDTTRVGPFIRRLYDSLQVRRQYADPAKKPILTTAILSGWAGEWWAKHEWMFDQINIMTYDMAQSMGWGVDRTWHNNAVFSPPPPTGTNLYYTSIQSRWIDQLYKRGGKNKSKYGVGIDFNGSLYKGGVTIANPNEGVSEPMQRWQTAPAFSWDYDFDLMYKTYLDTATSAVKRYDAVHEAAYLKIVVPPQYASDPTQPWLDETYLSYTDSRQINRIVQFAHDSSAGGIIIWNIGEGYLPSQYLERDRMLQAVKNAVFKIAPPPPKFQPRIRGEIFFDRESNGVKNSSDPLMPGWKVSLSGPAGVQTVLTDSSGKYEFDSLQMGEYTITLEVKNLWSPTFPLPAGQITYTTQLLNDTSVSVCDFGLYSSNVRSVQYGSGWSAVSLPLNVPDLRTGSVFPLASSTAFSYLSSYIPEDLLQFGTGYLVKFRSKHTLWTAGYNIDDIVIPVNEGWNIIGSISTPIPLSSVGTSPGGILTSPIYSFDNAGYDFTDSIIPGKGYWIRASQPGEIHLSKSANQSFSKFNDIKSFTDVMHSITFESASLESRKVYFSNNALENNIEDKTYYELPSIEGMGDFFDVRFSVEGSLNGGLVGFFSDGATAEEKLQISLTAVRYPLILRYKIENDTRYRYEIETQDKTVYPVEDYTEIQINKPIKQPALSSELIWLKRKQISSTDQQPKTFSLNQNYPNPFNNGTVIKFDLPNDGNVTLDVYNILGEKVAVLASGYFASGDHARKFEGDNLPSGLYLYKISYRDKSNSYYTETKRMLLLK
ncbi:MAG: T9SS type A sorting domain-containing protein [Ignavibacteriales bacterium]|nr:T9SS type A sorting domain-containing protein [Ignavibacteriales bacterium]